jgi:siroheme synthase (precorrin-2 oxidase/ferrochelatase)
MVLLAEPQAPSEGKIELIESGGSCTLYDSVDLPTESFTITPDQVGEAPLDFAISTTAGAPIQAPANVDYFGGCSG